MGGVDRGGCKGQRNSGHSDKTEGSLGGTEVHRPWLSERSPVAEMAQGSGEQELQCIFEQDSGDFVSCFLHSQLQIYRYCSYFVSF